MSDPTNGDHATAVAAHVQQIWPAANAAELSTRFIEAIGEPSHASTGGGPRWTERDVVLITYGDSITGIGRPLEALIDLVRSRLTEAFGIVHVLPFAPSSSDRGFSVIDYTDVDPAIGTWDDFAELRTHVDVMYDLVVNHTSAQSVWFQQFLTDEAPGNAYFITVDPTVTDLTTVVRPRSLPLLTTFDTASGPKHVWTTFSDDQVDLDWSNPDLVCEMLRIIDLFIDNGARFLRLDAIAYLWKEVGTSCVHLPQTHEVVKLIHTLLERRAPHVSLLTETNVPDRENRTYFGNGDEAHLIYNFTLPPLLIDGLLNGRSDRLAEWLATAAPPPPGTTMMNFMSSHDGIGVRPAEGFLSDDEIAELVRIAYRRGGMHGTYDRAGIPMPYEINISLPDLFGGPEDPFMVDRILLAHTVVLSLAGVAAVYVNSLLATTNDLAAVQKDGVRRSINRGSIPSAMIPLPQETTWQAALFDGLTHRAEIRRGHRAFHPDGGQHVSSRDGIVQIVRTAPDSTERITVLCNLCGTDRTVVLGDDTTAGAIDLLTLRTFDETVTLPPYGAVWLVNN